MIAPSDGQNEAMKLAFIDTDTLNKKSRELATALNWDIPNTPDPRVAIAQCVQTVFGTAQPHRVYSGTAFGSSRGEMDPSGWDYTAALAVVEFFVAAQRETNAACLQPLMNLAGFDGHVTWEQGRIAYWPANVMESQHG